MKLLNAFKHYDIAVQMLECCRVWLHAPELQRGPPPPQFQGSVQGTLRSGCDAVQPGLNREYGLLSVQAYFKTISFEFCGPPL